MSPGTEHRTAHGETHGYANLPRFMQFLVRLADQMGEHLKTWDVEESLQLTHRPRELRRSTEKSNGLMVLEVTITDGQNPVTAYLYASGTHRTHSMVKVELVDQKKSIICTDDPMAILAVIWFGH